MRYLAAKKARIEVVPMIDIMFFLLVFFIMITLKMIPSNGLAVRLPGSATAAPITRPKVVVTFHANGEIEAYDGVMTLAQLTEKLRAQDPASTVVTIAGDGAASVQQLAKVMDACRSAGVTQVGIATASTP
ncbi:ExbD/TolR family protein [Pandoraea anhela]|uniref:Biopolymer transporter ExbD n=1 Tax=Pandoraea anhela TaxID=2508295 RepID=A0A5E4Z7Z3_9BURK|nr:biopolymer transporter ExbD [Pandoraea anhela]VVE56802.1 biopolymer transporter ExbD [Pandoraea anhela]